MFGIVIKNGKTYDTVHQTKRFYDYDMPKNASSYFRKNIKNSLMFDNLTICEVISIIDLIPGKKVFLIKKLNHDEWSIIEDKGIKTEPHQIIKIIFKNNTQV